MSVSVTVDDVFETAGATSTIVILPEFPVREEVTTPESKSRFKVLARAKPIAAETVEAVPAATTTEPMTRRRVLSLATPMIGENLLQTAVGAVDTFMVAR